MLTKQEEPRVVARQAEASFELLKEHRAKLVMLTDKILSIFERLDISSRGPAVKALRTRLEDDRFRIMVLGEFKRGKSTFVNALLGQELLPAKVVPCTAVITEIRWGQQKRAVLHFRHPLPPKLPPALPKDVDAHLRQAGKARAPSLAIPVERLREYIEIPPPEKGDLAMDQTRALVETPYEKVEIWWPLEMCRTGVEIIDSPGLNEDEARARITANYLQHADAVLFTMLAMPFGSTTEFEFVDNHLLGAGYEHVFFIVNCWDTVLPRAREEVRQHVQAKLSSRTVFGENGIFFLSALNALEGKLDGDLAQVESSGILSLEKALNRFLVEDRGRVKLLQPARELSSYVREIELQVIPGQRQMLENNLADLLKKYDKVKPQLDEADRRRRQILQDFENKRLRLKIDVETEARQMLRRLVKELPGWVEEMETEKKIVFFTSEPLKQVKDLAEEVVGKVRKRLQKEVEAWNGTTLKPRLESWLKQTEVDLGRKSKDFFEQLQEIQNELFQTPIPQVHNSEGERGLDLGTLVSPLTETQAIEQDFRGVLAGIGAQIAALVILAVLGLSHPFIIVGMLVTVFMSSVLVLNRLEKEVKQKVAQILYEKIGESIDATAGQIAEELDRRVAGVMTKIDKALTADLSGVREQVEAVLRDKRAGEAKVEERRRLLETIAGEVVQLDETLRQTIFLLAGAKAQI